MWKRAVSKSAASLSVCSISLPPVEHRREAPGPLRRAVSNGQILIVGATRSRSARFPYVIKHDDNGYRSRVLRSSPWNRVAYAIEMDLLARDIKR